MTDDDPHGQILRLEDNIEELTEVLERCRKLILISRLAIIAGGICLFVLILGLIRFDAMFMIGAIAAIIGGLWFSERIRVHRSRLSPPSKPPKHSGLS